MGTSSGAGPAVSGTVVRAEQRRSTQRRRLAVVLGLNLALIVGLVVAGLSSGSLGVLAAAGDTAADSVGLVLGLVAVTLRDRPGREGRRSRATTVVALINGTALLVVTAVVVSEAAQRLRSGSPSVDGPPMVVASVVTALVLLVGAFVLGTDAGSEDLHMRSVLLDTLADAAAAAALAVAGVVILLTHGTYWLDPALAIVIGVVVAWAALQLLRDGLRALRGEEIPLDDD